MTGGGLAIRIDIGPGELADRLSILRLKVEKGRGRPSEAAIASACNRLKAQSDDLVWTEESRNFERELADINRRLWGVEDDLRALEKAGRFEADFVELARSVYRLNDRRAALKAAIDQSFGHRHEDDKIYGV